MTTCLIGIELDDPDRAYHPGDHVCGTVDVYVDHQVRCERLEVSCKWYTHGRGTPTSGSAQFVYPVTDKTWTSGDNHTYRFGFELPNGPCTYHGHYLNVDWKIEARATITPGSNPEAEHDLVVEPGVIADDEPYHIGDVGQNAPATAAERTANASSSTQMGCAAAILSTFIGFCVVFAIVAAREMLTAQEDVPLVGAALFFLIPGVLICGALWLLWNAILRNKFAEVKLSDLDVYLEPFHVHAGNDVTVAVDIPAESDVDLHEISVELRPRERVQYRRGTNTRTRTHDLAHFAESHVISDSTHRSLPEGQAGHFEYDLSIPHDAPPSFRAHRNELNWLVDVHIDIDDWPDWMTTLHLDVYPPTTTAASSPDFSDETSSDTTPSDDAAPETDAVW